MNMGIELNKGNEKAGEVSVAGHATFSNGKLITPKSGKWVVDWELWKLWGITNEEIELIESGDLTIEDTEAFEAYEDDLADCFQGD